MLLGRVTWRPSAASERTDCLRDLAPDAAMRRRESLVHVLLNHHDFLTIRCDLAKARGPQRRPRGRASGRKTIRRNRRIVVS
jgi:hypothetical protein